MTCAKLRSELAEERDARPLSVPLSNPITRPEPQPHPTPAPAFIPPSALDRLKDRLTALLPHRFRRKECPLCGKRSSRFKAHGWDHPVLRELQVVGGGKRDGVVCPRCRSTDRERLVYLYLQRQTRLFQTGATSGVRLLHLAPERALSSRLRATLGSRYVSGDLSSRRAQLHLDVTALPFRDGTFDALICNHVLEHVPQDHAALQEFRRVLRPGGWAILQVPLSLRLEQTLEDPAIRTPQQREARYGQHDHVRLYGRDYPRRLEAAGFQVGQWGCEGLSEARRYALLSEECLHIAIAPGSEA